MALAMAVQSSAVKARLQQRIHTTRKQHSRENNTKTKRPGHTYETHADGELRDKKLFTDLRVFEKESVEYTQHVSSTAVKTIQYNTGQA
jgi:hypothetical protein